MGMISKIDKKTLLFLNIKTSEARSMAFYNGFSEKSKVHVNDFKNQ
ncbi:hypothetical protein T4B_8200 [Trichinella pseudospiralis]|uniref:Uncharacterized protein n=1 Tax=Trichinella pseudospiralis TaxID=6337 RepID=A0A0V1GE92_TRIPS|nr:hypothetical protein T4B_8200 [Trichinella pseudospiralis]KRY96760.1 hypothetical protein T4C_7443 [Trichinella pseudospiralis]